MILCVIASRPCSFLDGAILAALSLWLLVMCMSRVTYGGIGVWCNGASMSTLSGCCGCVHGAADRFYAVALCCYFW